MTIVIGLCGNIGSGKSLAAAMLKEMGAAIIDADALARLVVEPGRPAYDEICAAFGPKYLLATGGLDRKKLGGLVFADAKARGRLNAITHPRIRAEATILIESYRAGGYALIVLEAALLLANDDYRDLLDEIWLIEAPREQVYARLAARDNLTVAEAEARLNAQMPVEEQAKLADRVIVNNSDAEALRAKLAALYHQLI